MKSYLGSRYDLNEDQGMPSDQSSVGVEQMQPAISSGGSGASAATTAATAAAGANPYALGASFLLSYMQARQQEFERKRQAALQNQQQYAQTQDHALDSLNNSWKSALLK
jgi:hypothetical protein